MDSKKGINLQITELKEAMISVINKANLPIAVTQMALFEITTNVNNLAAQQIAIEKQAYEKSKEGVSEDGKEVH